MEYHLKFNALAEYVEQFSATICEVAFQNTERLGGKDLVKLTPSAQVNAFLVKSIFEKWQQEASKIQSPFFDYGAPDVQERMSDLMKVLSSHISVDKAHLEPMLAQAVFDTFIAQFNPKQYFRGLFASFTGEVSVSQDLQALLKYVKLHPNFIEKLYKGLLAEGMILAPSVPYKVVQRVSKNEALFDDRERVENTLKPLQSVLDFKISDLVSNWVIEKPVSVARGIVSPVMPGNPEEMDDAPEIHESFSEKTAHYEEEDYIPEDESVAQIVEEDMLSEEEIVGNQERPITESDKAGIHVDNDELSPISHTESKPTLDDDSSVNLLDLEPDFSDIELDEETNNPNVEKAEVPEVSEEEKNERDILIDSILGKDTSEPVSLHQKLGGQTEEKKVAPLHEALGNENTPNIGQLKGSIPLNMKFKFQNELFGGDNSEFTGAVDMIDTCKDYHTAIALLKEKYIRRFNWDLGAETTRDFLSLVDRKFD